MCFLPWVARKSIWGLRQRRSTRFTLNGRDPAISLIFVSFMVVRCNKSRAFDASVRKYLQMVAWPRCRNFPHSRLVYSSALQDIQSIFCLSHRISPNAWMTQLRCKKSGAFDARVRDLQMLEMHCNDPDPEISLILVSFMVNFCGPQPLATERVSDLAVTAEIMRGWCI